MTTTDAAVAALGLTPSQTVGPFLHIALSWPDGPYVVPEGTLGSVVITGQLFDGAGRPVSDGLIETWQADPAGRFAHAGDPRGAVESSIPGFRGFGRCPTDAEGRFHLLTVKPGPLPAPDGRAEAPHLDVSVFARGLLDRVVTRVYFPDEAEANAADPVLSSVADEAARATLIAGTAEDGYVFDIRLRGEGETVFFAI
jgi:protocatechuate 3,4-dioxygenase alpha subunit